MGGSQPAEGSSRDNHLEDTRCHPVTVTTPAAKEFQHHTPSCLAPCLETLPPKHFTRQAMQL